MKNHPKNRKLVVVVVGPEERGEERRGQWGGGAQRDRWSPQSTQTAVTEGEGREGGREGTKATDHKQDNEGDDA